MSHIVTIETQIRDAEGVRRACQRRGLPAPLEGTHRLFSSSATGLAVQLRDWRYPLVCELATGKLRFDDFEGRWGSRAELDGFLQAYAVEKATLEARRQGHSVTESPLADGSIRLTIRMGGAA